MQCRSEGMVRSDRAKRCNSTRAAVRDSIIFVIIFNYFMTWFFYQQ